jgi:transketolase
MFATQEHLSNLIMIVDYNKIQALGYSKDIENLEPLDEHLKIFGWNAVVIDGHDVDQIRSALTNVPISSDRPTAIIANTVKCKGIDYLENTVRSHYNFVPDDKIEEVIAKIKEGK